MGQKVITTYVLSLQIKQQWDWTKSYHNLCPLPTNKTAMGLDKKLSQLMSSPYK
jgi:hypothetical protein